MAYSVGGSGREALPEIYPDSPTSSIARTENSPFLYNTVTFQPFSHQTDRTNYKGNSGPQVP